MVMQRIYSRVGWCSPWGALIHLTYHFVKRTNGYKLPDDLNEPLSPKHNCVAVSDNHAEVMIEIQQSGDLIFVFNKANFLDNTLKLFEV